MGANVGTSVTSTLVALGHAGRRAEFARAFAAATLHDMFNWSTVIALLPLETATRFLERSSGLAAASLAGTQSSGTAGRDLLTALTRPVSELVVQLDAAVVRGVALHDGRYVNVSLLRQCRDQLNVSVNCDHHTPHNSERVRPTATGGFLLEHLRLDDTKTGAILLAASLATLLACLALLVRVLAALLRSRLGSAVRRAAGWSPQGRLGAAAAGWGALAVGCLLTAVLQSSSVVTSALTPLAGLGVLSLERVYPLTLGANLGTTTTGLLAAGTAASPAGLQLALCHLFFNVTGILLFYPLPWLRFPITLARHLGTVTGRYRWFAGVYIGGCFLVLPLAVFGLSMCGWEACMAVGVIVLALVLAAGILRLLQVYAPGALTPVLRSWDWLPLPLRSLEPYDRILIRCCPCLISEYEDDVKPVEVTPSELKLGPAYKESESDKTDNNNTSQC
ncbi:SLC34A2 [Cordylochernes scorpioides]|uniref:SLC34A2 n=1 Tax=Cordylochernes scorpioides TaxID=51811 RepID=A0ABY6LN70_9ARAC|nr:SLC34A2 [Cordylochernes scorpioides]